VNVERIRQNNKRKATIMQKLSQVTLPDDYGAMVSTGIECFDELFGMDEDTGNFGFVAGKVYMVSAPAGTGKTRLFLTVESEIARHNPDFATAHFTGEQPVLELRSMAEKMKIEIPENMFVERETRWTTICRNILEHDVRYVVIDSLPMIINEFPMVPDENGKLIKMSVKQKMELISKFATENNVVFVLINHTTKNGNWKGGTDIIHLVDVAITLKQNDKDYEGMKCVEFHGGKNRAGATVSRAFPFNGKWDLTCPMEVASSTGTETGEMNHSKVAERKNMQRNMILDAFKSMGGTVYRSQLDTGEFSIAEMVKSGILTMFRSLVDDKTLVAHREHTGGRGQPPISHWTLSEETEAELATPVTIDPLR